MPPGAAVSPQKYDCQVPHTPPCGHCFIICVSGNKVISHLLLTEPAPLTANHDDSTHDISLSALLTLGDLLNRELLLLISWAKLIPGTRSETNVFTDANESK